MLLNRLFLILQGRYLYQHKRIMYGKDFIVNVFILHDYINVTI